MEHNLDFHGRAPTPEETEKALEELELSLFEIKKVDQ
jgi:hypothetical protein